MKTWNTPEVATVDVAETAQGGKSVTSVDYSWVDDNKHSHSRFYPETQS